MGEVEEEEGLEIWGGVSLPVMMMMTEARNGIRVVNQLIQFRSPKLYGSYESERLKSRCV